MTSTIEPARSEPWSKFVTVVAWVFIVFTGIAALLSLMQSVVLFGYIGPDLVGRYFEDPENMPAFTRLIVQAFPLLLVVNLTASVVTLVSSIGLLKRKNWARVVFIGMMLFGIVYQFGCLIYMWSLMHIIYRQISDESQIGYHVRLIQAGSLVSALIGCLLLVWILRRLKSAELREEFGQR